MKIKAYITKERLAYLVLSLLTLAGLYFIFGRTLWQPNEYMYAFGGDPYLIYYNIAYHVEYGQGYYMENMAYPLKENPFMSGGEGSWALLLLGLKKLGLDLSNYVIGFVHVTKYLCIWLASLFMFKALVLLDVRIWTAAIFSVLLVFLDPIMLRMFSHYGLAYPMVIPMVLWWLAYRYKKPGFGWIEMGMAGMLIFFTLNNPYVGFSAAAFGLLVSSFLWLLVKDSAVRKSMLWVLLSTLFSVACVFIILKTTDPFSDRVEEQWGIFNYFASPAGFIAPEGSLTNYIINKVGIHGLANEFERKQYLGIVCLLVLTFALITYLVSIFRKVGTRPQLGKFFQACLIAALCLFVFTANKKLFPINEDWVEEHLGPLLMFKAVSRLAWSVYFVLTSLAVYLLDKWASDMKRSQSWIIFSVAALIWFTDISTYIKPNFNNIYNDNFWSQEQKANFDKDMAASGVDFTRYQAIMSVPKLELWSDKFISEINWATQFHTFRVSIFTGLPLVNSMLSRAPAGLTSSAIQMFSDPVVEKQRPKSFPDARPILLVLGSGYPALYRGEAALIAKAKKVYEDPVFSLYELPLSALDNTEAIAEANAFRMNETSRPPLFHFGFENDTSTTETHFFRPPGRLVKKGHQLIWRGAIPVEREGNIKISVWTQITPKKYGMGDWMAQTLDDKGSLVNLVAVTTRTTYEIQDDWARTDLVINYAAGQTLEVYISANQEFVIDDLLIDYDEENSVVDDGQSTDFLFNNFKVARH